MTLSPAERIALLAKSGKSEPEKVKNDGVITAPKKNGGARPGAGRKPSEVKQIQRGIKQWVDDHVNEKVKVQITDPKTGKTRVIEKPRVAVVLEALYRRSLDTPPIPATATTPLVPLIPGSTEAAKAWLDRALGRPLQPIGGDDEHPIVLRIDF